MLASRPSSLRTSPDSLPSCFQSSKSFLRAPGRYLLSPGISFTAACLACFIVGLIPLTDSSYSDFKLSATSSPRSIASPILLGKASFKAFFIKLLLRTVSTTPLLAANSTFVIGFLSSLVSISPKLKSKSSKPSSKSKSVDTLPAFFITIILSTLS